MKFVWSLIKLRANAGGGAVVKSVKDNKVYQKDKPIMLEGRGRGREGESAGGSNFKSIVDLFAMRAK